MAEADGPFRDGKLWVLDQKCATCIFRPGNPMRLREGTVNDMVEDCIAENTVIACHDTLYDTEHGKSTCRGFYDVHRQDVVALRLAEALGIFAFDSPPGH